MTNAFAIPLVRKRRKKPWRPVTRFAFAATVFAAVMAVWCFTPWPAPIGPLDVFLGCLNTVLTVQNWRSFRRLREQDERD